MQIARVTPAEHSEFLALINAEIRPDRAKTNAWEDFPVVLGPKNSEFQLVARDDDGALVGGIACLIRQVVTTCGSLDVGGIGSVVTRPDRRGRGISTALQNEILAVLRRKEVPLAVLWTDQPEIYAGRGFTAAGWEAHVDLSGMEFAAEGSGGRIRDYRDPDAEAVEALFRLHPCRTERLPGDSRALYGMPGTRGLVLETEDKGVAAALFCGKGADFPGYVTEWSGARDEVLTLLGEAAGRGWADHLLAPAGTEALVNHLVDRGATWCAHPSGQWAVLDPDRLVALCAAAGAPVPDDRNDAASWLGTVDAAGAIRPGPIGVAIWGFDSV